MNRTFAYAIDIFEQEVSKSLFDGVLARFSLSRFIAGLIAHLVTALKQGHAWLSGGFENEPESHLPIAPTPARLPPGYRVDGYLIEGVLGMGTFGTVYRATQQDTGRPVAVKVLNRKYSVNPCIVSRFIAESWAVHRIHHENIIDIFAFGQLPDGRHYHVMELLAGEPLDIYVMRKGGRLKLGSALPILRGLARALDAAHAAGIAHRDLKPANVFLTQDADGHIFPKLLDFGIAKLMTDDRPHRHETAIGTMIGTPDYMSPEQCEGHDVDHRTDIYAFGVLTFKLLVGRLPFRGENIVEVVMQHIHEPAPRPSEVNPAIVSALDEPILAMLAKTREDRPPTLIAAVSALEAAAQAAGCQTTRPSDDVWDPVVQSSPRLYEGVSASAFATTVEDLNPLAYDPECLESGAQREPKVHRSNG